MGAWLWCYCWNSWREVPWTFSRHSTWICFCVCASLLKHLYICLPFPASFLPWLISVSFATLFIIFLVDLKYGKGQFLSLLSLLSNAVESIVFCILLCFLITYVHLFAVPDHDFFFFPFSVEYDVEIIFFVWFLFPCDWPMWLSWLMFQGKSSQLLPQKYTLHLFLESFIC